VAHQLCKTLAESFNHLLEQNEFSNTHISKQTQLLRQLSETPLYRKEVEILQSIPAIGIISIMAPAV
jgi:hypothetical protein